MRKIYHLANCTTCQRILKDWKVPAGFEYQDIKTEAITEKQIDEMRAMTTSFEALFSRRAMKYREWGLHEKKLTEDDYRSLILQEYTFLKRPVLIVDNDIFIGNAKRVVEAAGRRLRMV